jgi:trimeric autotransporter adhesin
MSSMKQKLRLAGALGMLAMLALAVSCRGFFVNPTLTSIAISPTAPQIEVGKTLQLQAFGTYDDGTRAQVKSGISWSSDTPSVAVVDLSSGLVTGASLGTATITGDAQGLSSTATATVFLGSVTSIIVTPSTGNVSITAGLPAQFTAEATAAGQQVDITGSASWTLTPASTTVTCSFVGPEEDCTATDGVGTYTITVSYPGTTVVGTATLTVNP